MRHFTVLVGHGHFGRAVVRPRTLRFPQSSLSRQIQRLEQELGARLIDRGPQGCRPTEAGAVFLPYGKSLLATAAQAAALTRVAAQPHRITVGYTAHLVVTPAILELRKQNPEARVQTAHLGSDVRDALLEHRVDVAVTRLPFPTEQLHIATLYDEPRVLLMRDAHRGRQRVRHP